MNITLKPELESKIQSQLNTGKYETVEQVLLEALQALEERNSQAEYSPKTELGKKFQELLKETQALHADRPLTEEEIAAEIDAYRRGE